MEIDWLTCNRCFRVLKGSTKKFVVTSCEHLFCSVCIDEAKKKCPQCKAVGSQTIILQNPMPPNMQHYFTPMSVLIDRTRDAVNFQINQFVIAKSHTRLIEEKYEKLRKAKMAAVEQRKVLIKNRDELRETLRRLREIDVQSVNVTNNSNSDSSINYREERSKRASAGVSASSHARLRDYQYSQQKKSEMDLISVNVQPRIIESRILRENQNSSRPSANNREEQIKRTPEYNQPSAHPRSKSRSASSQYRMITESSNCQMPSIITYSHSSNHHRESQNRRAVQNAPKMMTESPNIPEKMQSTLEYNRPKSRPRSSARVPQHRLIAESSKIAIMANNRESQNNRAMENAPRGGYQNRSNTQITNYRYNPNHQFNGSQYPPRSILSSTHSRLDRTPPNDIYRGPINQRILQSMETVSNISSSGGTVRQTPNSEPRFPKYDAWNMRSN